MSRDLHRLDVCVADTATGEVKALIEERLNIYIETQAALDARQRPANWSSGASATAGATTTCTARTAR